MLDEGGNGRLGSKASVRFAIKGRVFRGQDRCTVSQVQTIMGEALEAEKRNCGAENTANLL